MTVRVRQVGRASDPQAEMQLQELTRAVNELGGDVEGVQRTLPDVIEDIEKELDNRIPIPTEPPTIPTNLVAIPAFQMFILKWDRSVAEIVDGYIISFSTSEDGTSWSEWEEIVLPNISVFTHTGLDFNLYYRYRVLAYNRAGRSLWSNTTEAQKPIKVSLSEQIIDEHNWMEIWDRAAAISEEGKFLAEKIDGFIKKHQLEETVRETLDGVYELGEDFANAVARLDTNDDTLWYSSIKQVADGIVSEVARVEGALNDPDSEMWYSSIKQTADEISQTVAKLTGDDPDQFSTIQQLADQITSIVVDLKKGTTVVEGTITSRASNYFVDISKNWDTLASQHEIESWIGFKVIIIDEEDTGQTRQITGYSGSQLNVSPNWNPLPAVGSKYAVVGNDAVGAAYTQIQQTAYQITNLASDLHDLGEDISAVAQTADEISSTVAKKEFTGPIVSGSSTLTVSEGVGWVIDSTKSWSGLAEDLGISNWENLYLKFTSGENEGNLHQITRTSGATVYFSPVTKGQVTAGDTYEIGPLETVASTTFQQTADMINQRVMAVDSNGNPIVAAQIQVGQVDGNGYILLDASDIFVPGTVHVFDRNPGSAASGQVTIDSDGIEVRDGAIKVINTQTDTVIIDGTSNMFKIRNSGYLWADEDSVSSVVFDIPSSEVYIPAFHILYEGFGVQGSGYGNFDGDAMWPFIIDATVGLVRSIVGGLVGITRINSSQVRLDLKCGRDILGIRIRYYIFKEAAF